MAKAAQRQFRVKIAADPTQTQPAGAPGSLPAGYWSQKTGGETSATLSKVFDGANPIPTVLPGVPETSDLVLTKPYDPSTDQATINALRLFVGAYYAVITVQPTDPAFAPVGPQETYYGLLSAVTPPEVNAASSDAATFSLTFAISQVTGG